MVRVLDCHAREHGLKPKKRQLYVSFTGLSICLLDRSLLSNYCDSGFSSSTHKKGSLCLPSHADVPKLVEVHSFIILHLRCLLNIVSPKGRPMYGSRSVPSGSKNSWILHWRKICELITVFRPSQYHVFSASVPPPFQWPRPLYFSPSCQCALNPNYISKQNEI